MKKSMMVIAGGVAALGLAVVVVPSRSSASQQDEAARVVALQSARQARVLQEVIAKTQEGKSGESNNYSFVLGDEGASWLGVETHEVTADTVKDLKLPAERGVVLGRVIADSPASKAGLKDNDVVTEFDGQRVEGAAQFRRMIREVPAGRTVQLTVWRDGRTQAISVTLGAEEQNRHKFSTVMPSGSYAMNLRDLPKVMEMPEMNFGAGNGAGFGWGIMNNMRPRLGVDVEEIEGQLGKFFGAPDGEGVLVSAVNSGSPAEKAGLKAGDVITSVDGERIRSVGDLHEKLAKKDEGKTVKLGVVRNHSETSVTVELPAAPKKTIHKITLGTNI
ncbi:MAG TPA: PDZ domain-containing protein [Candidatus Acidoferrum sp.]|jgi:serine protease Do